MVDKEYDVITVGSNTIDTFVYTDRVESLSMKTVASESKFICYPLGSKLRINELDYYTGGGGTNTAVCLSRLGFKVGYVGKIGNDLNNSIILKELKEEKIDFLGVISKGEKTGYSVILDSKEYNRTILTYRGANDTLKTKELDFSKFKTKWFHFSAMIEDSFKTLERIAVYAKNNKINICFNPNNYLCERGKDFLKIILSNLDILVLNSEEASLLTDGDSIKDRLLMLKSLGPKKIVVTNGVGPIYCIDDNSKFYTVYPIDIPVVEVTGAGDSFSSSFLAGIIKTGDFNFAIELAIANSHSVLGSKGAKNILLTYDEAKVRILENKVRIKEGIETEMAVRKYNRKINR